MELTENKPGYCTITYKLRLYIKHIDFINLTKDIYNQVVLFYYNLLLENIEFLNLSNQYCLRELEKITIISRNGEVPKNYLDMDLPTYFRRSAINQAIGSVRSYISLVSDYEKQEEKRGKEPSITTEFNCSPVFYQGMYKELKKDSVMLKLWNGYKWEWFKAKLKGREFDEKLESMSPTLVINSRYVMMHLPVREVVEDVRPVKERMQDENLKVCGISFSNTDNIAICTILNRNGEFVKSKFISGGNFYKSQTERILKQIKKHRQKGKKTLDKADHKTYWEKLNRIRQNMAHKVSKEIIDFCLENEVKVISITKLEDDVSGFGHKVGKYSPITLRRIIVNYLSYKSFRTGILITTVRQNYTASKCHKCRAKVKRNESEFSCENGHNGNYYFNTAMNVGKMCLKKFGLILD